MAVDAAGNIYVTGMTSNGTNTDFLTVKYNAAGAIQWRAIANGGGNGDDIAYAIALDANGNVLVTGSSQSDGQADYLTVKYDNNGVEQWRATMDGAAHGDDYAIALAVDALGNVFVTGASTVGSYNVDYLTVQYSPAGSEIWRASLDGGANGIDHSVVLCLDSGGNAVVTGYGLNTLGNYDYLTVKYSAAQNGQELWKRQMNNGGSDVAFAMACDGGDNVYVTGKSWNGVNDDYVTAKYDAAGVPQWQTVTPSAANMVRTAVAIAIDGGGSAIVTGSERNRGIAAGPANPVRVTVKYDAGGAETWRATLNGSGTGNDTYTALTLDGAGNIYTTGFAVNGATNELVVVKYLPGGTPQWQTFISGIGAAGSAALQSIAVDLTGGVIASGYRSNGIDNDFMVVRLDANGVLQWLADEGENTLLAATLGAGNAAPSAVTRNAVATDAAGNVYVAGQSGQATGGDFVTAKIDAGGAEKWRTVMRGFSGGLDRAYAVAVDGSGNVFAAGDSVAGGYSDFMTVKYDANGVEQWRAQPGHAANAFNSLRGLAVDPFGNIVVTGYSSAGADFLTIKYDNFGQEIWKRTANGTANGSDLPVALAIDAAGNIFVAGRSFDGAFDGYLTIKYDPGGIEQWRATLNGSASAPQQPFAIAFDAMGDVVVAGDSVVKYDAATGSERWRASDGFRSYAVSSAPDGAIIASGSGGQIAKYDQNGNLQWRLAINGSIDGNDLVYAVTVDADGNIYATWRNAMDIYASYRTVKFSPHGSERWRITTPTAGGGIDASPSVALDVNRHVIIAGNAMAAGQPSAIMVAKYSQAPAAPTNVAAVAGSGLALISYAPPAITEAPIAGYAVTCQPGGVTATGAASPLLVTGLTNETTYACTVTASNAYGSSPPSPPVSVTPSASVPFALFGAQSRKTHGSAGEFGVDIETNAPGGAITVEPRAIGAGHRLLFAFNRVIHSPGVASVTDAMMSPVGAAVTRLAGGIVEVMLTAIPDNTRALVSLTGLNGTADVISVPIGFLVGDVTGSRAVNAADIAAAKAHSGQTTGAGNFRFDVNASGTINSADVSVVKSRSGVVLP